MTYKLDTTYVIGSGDWGTALSFVMQGSVDHLSVFARKASNRVSELKVVTTIDKKIDLMVIALPSDQVGIFLQGAGNLAKNAPSNVLIATKGLYPEKHQLMSELVASYYNDANIAIISGPNFASEVIKGMPTISTIASKDIRYAKFLCNRFTSSNFVLEPSDDIIGTQLFGVFKNILAIFCGVLEAKDMGFNARAAFITKGIREALLLVEAMGGKMETALSAAGIGDTVLTCTSTKSRNYRFGKEFMLGQIQSQDNTIEGIKSLESIIYLAKKYNVKLPICRALYKLIIEADDSAMEINSLLNA